MKNSCHFALTALAGAALLALVACGGGSNNAVDTPVDPAGTLRGTVAATGPVQNTLVCMDLNNNAACDEGEPASAATGADGAYVLSYNPASLTAEQVAAASLIAPQTQSTIDTGDGISTVDDGSNFVLRQVPGRAGQINPLTTMLAKGMADGMSEADARSNMALQLGIDADKIDNYQSSPTTIEETGQDTARLVAMFVSATLQQGIELEVGRQTAALTGLGADLRRLVYTDLDNFTLREGVFADKAEGSTRGSLADRRIGESGGAALTNLYNQAYLSPAGWVRCDDTATPITFTLGTPNRATYCNAQHSIGVSQAQSIAGQAMADVVNALQSDGQNFINPGVATAGLLAALGGATFPPDSGLRSGFSQDLNRPLVINSLNTDGQPQSRAATLAQLVAARPASGVDLTNSFGSLSLGGYTVNGENKGLRVAFLGVGQAVQYYVCDANSDFSAYSNCATPAQGTYTIGTENGVKVMRFLGQPTTNTDNVRMYVEVQPSTQVNAFIGGGNWVFQARQKKPDVDSNTFYGKRLNGPAWAAMRTQLGL